MMAEVIILKHNNPADRWTRTGKNAYFLVSGGGIIDDTRCSRSFHDELAKWLKLL